MFDRRVSSLGPLADFAGGVVRVEHSTSAYLNGYYPGETLAIEPEPLVRNTLASAKRRSESLALEASIAAERLAQMPEKKRQRNRGKKKGPSPPLPKLKRLELSTLSNCAVLIAEDVARMDTVYFHLAAGVIATINVARLQRITAADSVTAADLF